MRNTKWSKLWKTSNNCIPVVAGAADWGLDDGGWGCLDPVKFQFIMFD